MVYSLLAGVVLVIHFLFVLFVVFGALFVFWKPWIAFIHLPIAIYGILIEWVGWICPLTPLENFLLRKAGRSGYEGGFVEQYILPIIYPAELTRGVAISLGVLVLVINLVIYGIYLFRR